MLLNFKKFYRRLTENLLIYYRMNESEQAVWFNIIILGRTILVLRNTRFSLFKEYFLIILFKCALRNCNLQTLVFGSSTKWTLLDARSKRNNFSDNTRIYKYNFCTLQNL